MQKSSSYCSFLSFLVYFLLLSLSQAYIVTKSAPIASDPYLLFQGANNELYRISLSNPELYEDTCDPDHDLTATDALNLVAGHGECLSQPCVTHFVFSSSNFIYFEGADHELCKIRIDGKCFKDLGKKTKSTPALNESDSIDPFIYFQAYDDNADPNVSVDNHLCKIGPEGNSFVDFSATMKVGIKSTPFVYCQHAPGQFTGKNFIFFQAADLAVQDPKLSPTSTYDNHLCKVGVDGIGFNDLKYKTLSRPWVGARDNLWSFGLVYFQSASTEASALNELCSIQTDGACFHRYRVLTYSAPFGYLGGDQCYFQGYDANENISAYLPYTLIWSSLSPLCLSSEVMLSAPTQSPFGLGRNGISTLFIQDQANHLKGVTIPGAAAIDFGL